MTRSRTVLHLAAAALAGWSALAAAAPGVTGRLEFEAVVRGRARGEAERVVEAGLRGEAFRLWKAGGYGGDRSERAAWVVQAAAGVAWLDWPWDRRYLASRWLGPAPVGAMAIVHTHPAVVDPRPWIEKVEASGGAGRARREITDAVMDAIGAPAVSAARASAIGSWHTSATAIKTR